MLFSLGFVGFSRVFKLLLAGLSLANFKAWPFFLTASGFWLLGFRDSRFRG